MTHSFIQDFPAILKRPLLNYNKASTMGCRALGHGSSCAFMFRCSVDLGTSMSYTSSYVTNKIHSRTIIFFNSNCFLWNMWTVMSSTEPWCHQQNRDVINRTVMSSRFKYSTIHLGVPPVTKNTSLLIFNLLFLRRTSNIVTSEDKCLNLPKSSLYKQNSAKN